MGAFLFFSTKVKERGKHMLSKIRELERKCIDCITRQLRRVNILTRLNSSFLVLLIGVATFLTFFSFCKYSQEVIFHLEPVSYTHLTLPTNSLV